MICFCDEACLHPGLPLNAACQNKSASSSPGHPAAPGSLHIHSVSFASGRQGRGGQPRPLSPGSCQGAACLPGTIPAGLLSPAAIRNNNLVPFPSCAVLHAITLSNIPPEHDTVGSPLHSLPPPHHSHDAGRSPGLVLVFLGLGVGEDCHELWCFLITERARKKQAGLPCTL